MSESQPFNQDTNGAVCKDCKRTRDHVATILPFQVIEKIVDKPLRIRGVAMSTGMSRNFNIYTPEELQAFASKLVNSPVYIEYVRRRLGHKSWTNTQIYVNMEQAIFASRSLMSTW